MHGITRCGECLQDEHAFILLLCKTCQVYPEAYARITNEMGELLMIMGSKEYVPEDEDAVEYERNNNWIHGGVFERIPFEAGAELGELSVASEFSIADAYNYIKTGNELEFVPELDEAALGFVGSFLEDVESGFQRVKVYIPRVVAAILNSRPKTISLAHHEFEFSEKYDSVNETFPDLKHFDVTEDMVEMVVRVPKLVFALWHKPSQPPSWFQYFIPDDDSVSYNSALLGAQLTGSMDLLAQKHAEVEEVSLEMNIGDLKLKYNEQNLFDDRIKRARVTTPHGRSEVKEELDEYLYEICHPDTFNLIDYKKDLRLPTDAEIAKWDQTVDSRLWLDEILNQKGEFDRVKLDTEEDPMKMFLEKIKDVLENDEQSREDSSDSFVSSDDFGSSDDEKEKRGALPESSSKGKSSVPDEEEDDDDDSIDENDPLMDEDDFFEYFLIKELKLSPEEVESYRASV